MRITKQVHKTFQPRFVVLHFGVLALARNEEELEAFKRDNRLMGRLMALAIGLVPAGFIVAVVFFS